MTTYLCPLCNGLIELHHRCPKCQKEMLDKGRLGDFFGPYSAYLEIDTIKNSNGHLDLMNHQCIHIAACPNCHYTQQIAMNEQLFI
ncbi:hypothetical protein L1765_00435 [Microaerobacter geothermalis]|uniref:hypothetical protein n=1 Tax=Microaerobacter geothermalis TaxID=674972 RepID=UPI001F3DD8D2|nr:hypothetical protein [Microaerobacter geothermalis]MCF6092458.1 hypothetical protein [Microaerobacter geothermalis]